MNATAAIRVTESSAVSEARRAVEWVASRLGFPDDRAGRAALVASELATNLARHAREGELLVRPTTDAQGELHGLEILALDKGPGIENVNAARQDGYSTGGTLGHGLGAVERQSDAMEIYTAPTGTAILARLFRDPPRNPAAGERLDIGAVHVSKPGEAVAGDSWRWRMRQGRLAIFVADGLGHGLLAHEAAEAAARVFDASPEWHPERLITSVHAALRATRGAAIASLVIDLERGTAAFAGLGNISGSIVIPGGRRHNMVSHNGTAGYSAARIQEFAYPVPAGAVVVLFSDGLGSSWDLNAYPGLVLRSPSLIAGVLYRDFSRRRDDVTVVVAKPRTALAEKL